MFAIVCSLMTTK